MSTLLASRAGIVVEGTPTFAPPECVKIYLFDGRRRAGREWLSVAFLFGHQVQSAPMPRVVRHLADL
jgi:hypothetical protein